MSPMTRRVFLMGGISLLPFFYLERYSPVVTRYRVPIQGLPAPFEGFTILQLSDLHDKEFGSGGRELLNLLKDERFDLVAFTGDLVLGPRPVLTPALELTQALNKRPVYSVSGNHDWSDGDVRLGERIKGGLQEAGACVLSNSCDRIERGGSHLWVAGVDDPVTGRDRLDQALPAAADGAPRILLSHSPQLYPEAAAKGVDLLLAGHTHGGQIRMPLLGAPFVPGMGMFPRWDYGCYRTGSSTLIVNGGLGESWLPIRFNIRPEVTLVTLERA